MGLTSKEISQSINLISNSEYEFVMQGIFMLIPGIRMAFHGKRDEYKRYMDNLLNISVGIQQSDKINNKDNDLDHISSQFT